MRLRDLGSPPLNSGIFLYRRTGVVLLAPGEIPDCGDDEEGDEDDGSVIHCFGCDGEVGWHAEEGHGESGPGFIVVSNFFLL